MERRLPAPDCGFFEERRDAARFIDLARKLRIKFIGGLKRG
jgi:hypothetical protein